MNRHSPHFSLPLVSILCLSLIFGGFQPVDARTAPTTAAADLPTTLRSENPNSVVTFTHGVWTYEILIEGTDETLLESGNCANLCTYSIDWRGRGKIHFQIRVTSEQTYPGDLIDRRVFFDGPFTAYGYSDLPNTPVSVSEGIQEAFATGEVDLDVLPNYDESRGWDWGQLALNLQPYATDTYWDVDENGDPIVQTVTYEGYELLYLYLHQSAFLKMGDIRGGKLMVSLIDRNRDPTGRPVTLETDTFNVYPATAYTDESGQATFLVTPGEQAYPRGVQSPAGQGVIQGEIQVRSDDIESPPVLKQAYFARVTAVSGKVIKIVDGTPSDIAVDDVLSVGTKVRLDAANWPNGYHPYVAIAFSDGSHVTAEQTLQGAEYITEFTVGEGAMVGGNFSMVNEVLVPGLRIGVESVVISYALGPLGLGFWAAKVVGGGVRKYVVDPIVDHFLSGSPRGSQPQTAPFGTGEALTRTRLVISAVDAHTLKVENWGQATTQISDESGQSMLLPNGTGASLDADSAFPAPASLDRGIGSPFTLTISPTQGASLNTQTPRVSLFYTSTDSIAPESLQARLNGRLFSSSLLPGLTQTNFQVPLHQSLKDGNNTLTAFIQTEKGVQRSASAIFSASASPALPQAVRTAAAGGQVLIDWEPNREADLAGYRVFRSPSETGSYTLLTTVPISQAVFLDAAPLDPAGWYQVQAVDTSGHASGLTPAVLAAPAFHPTLPAAPSGFSAVGGEGLVTLHFDDGDPLARAWRVMRGLSASGPFSEVGLTNRSGFQDRDVSNGTSYWYQLIPIGGGLQAGPPVATGPVIPQDAAPGTPAGLTARITHESVTLEWDPAQEADVTGYRIWRAEPGQDFSLLSMGLVTANSFQDTVLMDHLYAWKVSAVDANGHESLTSDPMQLAARRSDARYYLLIPPSPGGSVQVDSGAVMGPPYPYGTHLSLTPLPMKGYRFVGWSGDLSGSQEPLALVLEDHLYLLPIFEPIPVPGALPATTFAGTGQPGAADGPALEASFSGPAGIAVDGQGNVFVADKYNNKIRKISPQGMVSTFAGAGYGFVDGSAVTARFNDPHGLALDAQGNLYVADTGNHAIRKISPTGNVTTLAGISSGMPGYQDGPGPQAQFYYPYGLVVDQQGTVFVADSQNYRIRKVTPSGVVSTLPNYFQEPRGIALGLDGTTLFIVEAGQPRISKMTSSGQVSVLAGSGQSGNQDGSGSAASFELPGGLALDASGVLYLADQNNHRVRRITPEGQVTTLSGCVEGFMDGVRAQFSYPTALAIDAHGQLLLGDMNNQRIRQIATRVTAPLTPAGGGVLTVTTSTYELTVTFPAGSVGAPLTLAWSPDSAGSIPSSLQVAGAPFALVAKDGTGALVTHFNQPFTLQIHYTADDIAGIQENTLALFTWNETSGQWESAPATLDRHHRTLTASLSHLSRFAMLGRILFHSIYLPLISNK